MQFDIQIIWISRTFCMLFPMAGVNSRKSYVSVYVHVHTHTLSGTSFIEEFIFHNILYFCLHKSIISPNSWLWRELPLITPDTWRNPFFPSSNPWIPTSFSIHWLRRLIQLISEQTLNMEAILEESSCTDLNRHDPGAQLIKYWDCLNYLFIL